METQVLDKIGISGNEESLREHIRINREVKIQRTWRPNKYFGMNDERLHEF